MFKNLVLYRIAHSWNPDLEAAEKGLSTQRFVKCTPSQARSEGWIEPRGEAHGPLVESVARQWIVKLCIETKKVPSSVVQAALTERLKQIEETTGRKPGRKESKELKEEIVFELLPKAFPSQGVITAWIDPDQRLLAIDASTQGKADTIATALVKCIEGFAILRIETEESPAACMAEWLRTDESPNSFSIDRECELRAKDESKAVVRYGRHPLDIEEVKEHIKAGKLPTRLAMTWSDRVSLVLSETMQLKKLVFLDTSMEEGGGDEGEDSFDADVALMTGELGDLVDDLLEALGGEKVINESAAAED
ncbi:recombination-associated protein RdgC [Variovorax paradoxus]|nr:recombination-associated protein RdgC [Variovorax paradoxus]